MFLCCEPKTQLIKLEDDILIFLVSTVRDIMTTKNLYYIISVQVDWWWDFKPFLWESWVYRDTLSSGIILYMRPANERGCYIVTSSLIAWAHIQNGPCIFVQNYVWPGTTGSSYDKAVSIMMNKFLMSLMTDFDTLRTKQNGPHFVLVSV